MTNLAAFPPNMLLPNVSISVGNIAPHPPRCRKLQVTLDSFSFRILYLSLFGLHSYCCHHPSYLTWTSEPQSQCLQIILLIIPEWLLYKEIWKVCPPFSKLIKTSVLLFSSIPHFSPLHWVILFHWTSFRFSVMLGCPQTSALPYILPEAIVSLVGFFW